MRYKSNEFQEINKRRKFGIHLTSEEIFHKYIYPEIEHLLKGYIWVDLYAGEGNLILPILHYIHPKERQEFFSSHLFLFDVQEEMVEKSVNNAQSYGIPENVAKHNILIRDNLDSFPKFLKEKELPIFHITNPPYLYLGYIKKHHETQHYFKYFKGDNNGYQDLYQIAMINDLRNGIENLIYIIPSNFLYGASISNKFRLDFFKNYKILKMVIFETKTFEFTGTHICIGFFKAKKIPKVENLRFPGIKIKKRNQIIRKEYELKPNYKFRAGYEFAAFLKRYRAKNPLKVEYYLTNKMVLGNLGPNKTELIDANQYKKNTYKKLILGINEELKQKLESNILYIRTVDTGSYNGRVGLGIIKDDFNVYGIYVSGKPYRTHPIQIFFEPQVSLEDQFLLKSYFNFILEYFRKTLDSEFLTTYKYSNADYTRKYLGLNQTRKLIETFPIKNLNKFERQSLKGLIESNKFDEVKQLVDQVK
ncbi:MAG: SAM-dependent DNA methyltransferase [Promethearchaeota archaeon]